MSNDAAKRPKRLSSGQSRQAVAPVVLTSLLTLKKSNLSPDVLEGQCRSINDFERLSVLGEGTFGIVYKAKDLLTGNIVAVKRVKMNNESGGIPQGTLREVSILKKMNHENVVRLHCVAAGKSLESVFLIMEFCDQDLAAIIDNTPTALPENIAKCLAQQLCKGMAAMHDKNIVHRDIKLSNLLLNRHGLLKIADMGLAKITEEPPKRMSPNVVTLWYRAPELLFGAEVYGKPVDIWSVGCVIAELLDHRPLFPGTNELTQLELIISVLGTPHTSIWPEFDSLPLVHRFRLPHQPYSNLRKHFGFLSDAGMNILQKTLSYNPKARLSARDMCQHRYFRTDPLPLAPDMIPTFAASASASAKASP